MAIKISIGKLTLSKPFENIFKQIEAKDFEVLTISSEHTLQVSKMPFHHRDPFDRIIIAQCKVEHLSMISNDTSFSAYNIKLL